MIIVVVVFCGLCKNMQLNFNLNEVNYKRTTKQHTSIPYTWQIVGNSFACNVVAYNIQVIVGKVECPTWTWFHWANLLDPTGLKKLHYKRTLNLERFHITDNNGIKSIKATSTIYWRNCETKTTEIVVILWFALRC